MEGHEGIQTTVFRPFMIDVLVARSKQITRRGCQTKSRVTHTFIAAASLRTCGHTTLDLMTSLRIRPRFGGPEGQDNGSAILGIRRLKGLRSALKHEGLTSMRTARSDPIDSDDDGIRAAPCDFSRFGDAGQFGDIVSTLRIRDNAHIGCDGTGWRDGKDRSDNVSTQVATFARIRSYCVMASLRGILQSDQKKN